MAKQTQGVQQKPKQIKKTLKQVLCDCFQARGGPVESQVHIPTSQSPSTLTINEEIHFAKEDLVAVARSPTVA